MPLVAEYSKRFGVIDEMPALLAMSLGAGETTVMRMTAAYSMFANGGRRIRPTLIDRIQDRWGKTIFRHDQRICQGCEAEKWASQPEPRLIDKREQVLDPLTAYQMTSIMEGVVQRGTAQVLKSVGKRIAGKTGTTNEAKDVWFVGFAPDLAVGVYMGYDRPRSLGNSATAGRYAAPIFRDFMVQALKGKPDVPFRVPPGIKLVSVDPRSGTRSSGADSILEAFKPGTGPPEGWAGDGMGSGGGPVSDRTIGTGRTGMPPARAIERLVRRPAATFEHPLEGCRARIPDDPPGPRHDAHQVVELLLDRGQVRKDVAVVELEVVQHDRARPVMDELRPLVEEGRVVLVGLDHEELRIGEPRRYREVMRDTAHEEARVQAGLQIGRAHV
jgi:membrane peptidoglycan carboxypeptidase